MGVPAFAFLLLHDIAIPPPPATAVREKKISFSKYSDSVTVKMPAGAGFWPTTPENGLPL
jgi:hypothetical protein